MKTSKHSSQSGFSLLEILIAFSILALSIGIMLRIFSGGIKTAVIAEDYTMAVQIAESLMAKTGTEIPLKSHNSSGVTDDKYNWQVKIDPYPLASAAFDLKAVNIELYKVNVSVTWGDGDSNDRSLELTTLKLLTKNNNAFQ